MKPPTDFVDVLKFEPSFSAYLPYASEKNFTGRAVYPSNARAYLRGPVVNALVEAQRKFQAQGLSILIWDAYRPFSIQEIFWKVMPDSRYIAEPVREQGIPVRGSKHNRGAAVDLTLIEASGKELEMPSAFDDFSRKAHRDYTEASPTALKNRALLESVMKSVGFVGLPTEWWHFDWCNYAQFPLSDEPFERLALSI